MTGADSLSLQRSAVFGSTSLTRKLLEFLDDRARPLVVLGLEPDALRRKANGADLGDFCRERGIAHMVGTDWPAVAERLRELEVETVLVFGDSRIVPSAITDNYTVIGNHGALLPGVRGGASLVWGRMADLGHWGVSLFRLTQEIDGGDILATARFDYEPDWAMHEFVARADDSTISAFRTLIEGGATPAPPAACVTRLGRGVDSYEAVTALREAIANGDPIHMPIRTPADSTVKSAWPREFRKVFMVANDAPYPRWKADPGSGAPT